MNTPFSLSRRSFLALGAGAGAVCLTGPARAAAVPDVVVELFTSQGCSSCPPADAFLAELRAMPGVVALTYHVDYWDYLGWRDTLGNAEYSQRQYDYAKSRGDMDVYTPQIVINGRQHLVGSERQAVISAIASARQAAWPVALALSDTETEVIVDIGAGAEGSGATLWMMPVQGDVKVKIEKGEIAGREIDYHNVVRRLVPAGMWNGKAQRLSLPKQGLVPPECTSCVALLQQGKVGPVLGVATWGVIRT